MHADLLIKFIHSFIHSFIDFNREIDLSLSFLSFKTLVNDLRHVMKNLFFALCVKSSQVKSSKIYLTSV